MKGLIQLFRFMTRIPLGVDTDFDSLSLGKSMKLFPIVGMVIGLINYIFYLLFYNFLGGNSIITIVLLVLVELILTGGLHLDGLADTFDGIFSYRSKQKMLEIMKDSRLGSNGAIALIFYFILKISLYMACGSLLPILILVTPCIARLNSVINCYAAPYARPTGMGKTFADNTNFCSVIVALILSVAFSYGVFYYFGIGLKIFITIPILMFLGYIFARLMTKKIGGITGDTLGAVLELSQIVELFLIYVVYMNF